MWLAVHEGRLKDIKTSHDGPTISYLLFADDYILFKDATSNRARVLQEILKEYELDSRQCVNFEKLIMFF